MKLRRLSKSHLLVLGAFLAAGATALPALADARRRRAGSDALSRRPLLRRRLRLQPSEQRRRDRARRDSRARRTTTPTSATSRSTPRRRAASLVGGAVDAAATSATRPRTGCRPCTPAVARCGRSSASATTCAAPAARCRRSRRGLKMIAGDAKARRPQPLTRVGWACGGFGATPRSAVVPNCPPDRSLHLRVTFPSCWNGRDLDSADHKRHLAYATSGRCPRSHPVALPSLVLIFLYPSTESGRPVQASGRLRHACRLHQRLGSGHAGTRWWRR